MSRSRGNGGASANVAGAPSASREWCGLRTCVLCRAVRRTAVVLARRRAPRARQRPGPPAYLRMPHAARMRRLDQRRQEVRASRVTLRTSLPTVTRSPRQDAVVPYAGSEDADRRNPSRLARPYRRFAPRPAPRDAPRRPRRVAGHSARAQHPVSRSASSRGLRRPSGRGARSGSRPMGRGSKPPSGFRTWWRTDRLEPSPSSQLATPASIHLLPGSTSTLKRSSTSILPLLEVRLLGRWRVGGAWILPAPDWAGDSLADYVRRFARWRAAHRPVAGRTSGGSPKAEQRHGRMFRHDYRGYAARPRRQP